MTTKFHEPQALVVNNEAIGKNIFSLVIESQEIANEAKPGQFAHIRCGSSSAPLLRRPLSIKNVNRKAGRVYFWYQVVGKGTEFLSRLKEGEFLDVMGPLGRGFETDIIGKRIGLIGGGLGIAPLVFLGQELVTQNSVLGFFGGRSRDLMPRLSSLEQFPYVVATEDGSVGKKGFVTRLLEECLDNDKFDVLYACGPRPMLAEVVRIARRKGIKLQVSLESVMACGVGACLGCTIRGTRKKDTEEEENWLKVCRDGPVFWAEEVEWDE